MTADRQPLDLDALHNAHKPWLPSSDPRPRCAKDHQLFPCDTQQTLAELRTERERREALESVVTSQMETESDLNARIAALECTARLYETMQQALTDERERRVALEPLLAECVTMFQALQWGCETSGDSTVFSACPVCGAVDFRGHSADCELVGLMSKATALLAARGSEE